MKFKNIETKNNLIIASYYSNFHKKFIPFRRHFAKEVLIEKGFSSRELNATPTKQLKKLFSNNI